MEYFTILADPPWEFQDKGTRLCPQYAGKQRGYIHYTVTPLDYIKSFGKPIQEQLVGKDGFLFLWVPNSFVLNGWGQEVAEAWGFTPKQIITWVKTSSEGKPRFGGGHYTRVCTEQLLLCRRGKARVSVKNVPGVILAQRTRHSAKPNEQYEYIQKLSPGPYLELFARVKAPGWDIWGNELANDIKLQTPLEEEREDIIKALGG